MGSPSAQAGAGHGRSAMLPASLAALGVVYGDIGTSPLYAIRECFFGPHGVAPTHENVLGVLSLVTCALSLIRSRGHFPKGGYDVQSGINQGR